MYIVTITEVTPTQQHPDCVPVAQEVEHYRRRVDTDNIAHVIRSLDAALNVPVRKPRRDKGTTRKTEGGTPCAS